MTHPVRSRPRVGHESYYGTMSWASLKDKHQITHNGRVWYLAPTPKGSRWPWVLFTVPATPAERLAAEPNHYGPAVTRTEIGARDLDAAKHQAEAWLGLSKFCT